MLIYTHGIKELLAYKELEKQFSEKGYTEGISRNPRSNAPGTVGYYVEQIEHRRVRVEDIPKK